jgi:hypothetical protein
MASLQVIAHTSLLSTLQFCQEVLGLGTKILDRWQTIYK